MKISVWSEKIRKSKGDRYFHLSTISIVCLCCTFGDSMILWNSHIDCHCDILLRGFCLSLVHKFSLLLSDGLSDIVCISFSVSVGDRLSHRSTLSFCVGNIYTSSLSEILRG